MKHTHFVYCTDSHGNKLSHSCSSRPTSLITMATSMPQQCVCVCVCVRACVFCWITGTGGYSISLHTESYNSNKTWYNNKSTSFWSGSAVFSLQTVTAEISTNKQRRNAAQSFWHWNKKSTEKNQMKNKRLICVIHPSHLCLQSLNLQNVFSSSPVITWLRSHWWSHTGSKSISDFTLSSSCWHVYLFIIYIYCVLFILLYQVCLEINYFISLMNNKQAVFLIVYRYKALHITATLQTYDALTLHDALLWIKVVKISSTINIYSRKMTHNHERSSNINHQI